MSRVDPIQRLVRRVQTRERLRDAVVGLAQIALPAGLLLGAVAVAASRLFGAPTVLAWAALAPVPAVLLWAQFKPRSSRASARSVDAHYGLGDQLGNALEFDAPSAKLGTRDPRARALADAVITQASERAASLDPRPVVGISVPRLRRLDALCAALLACVVLLLPKLEDEVDRASLLGEGESEGIPADPTKAGIDMTLAEPLREELEKLREAKDPPAMVAAQMLEVLDALEMGEIDRAEALARLEALEEALAEAEAELEAEMEEDPWLLGEGVRELAEALREHEITQKAAEALAEGEGDEAEKALEEAFAKAEREGGKTQEAMDRALKDAERALGRAAGKNSDTASKLAEAERRLKKQKKQPAQNKEEQERRLKKQQKRVEELRRQHEKEKAAQRKLEQLRRLSKQSRGGSQGQKGGKKQRQDSQKKLGQGASGASQKLKRYRRNQGAKDALDEAKSFVRRSGKGGDKDKKRKDQQQKFSKAAKGDKGKGKKGKKGPTMLVEGELGDGPPDGILEGEDGEGQGQGEGQGEGEGEGQGQESSSPSTGDGMGSGTDDSMGPETERDVNHRNVKVNPDTGRGATRAEVIETASQDGFANESYRRVYRDYKSFAQSAMDDESMPPGQRRRVKRYYNLIQPRD